MSKIITIILIIFLILLTLANLGLLVFLIVKISKFKNDNSPIVADQSPITCSSSSNYNTDFYKKSIEHAEKVLYGKEFDPQYGEANFYGNNLIDTINKLNNETKQAVIIAIKHFSIESVKARSNEQSFRIMSEQERVPLWFIILREATKEAVPEFTQVSNNQMPMPIQSNIVPLYQKTG